MPPCEYNIITKTWLERTGTAKLSDINLSSTAYENSKSFTVEIKSTKSDSTIMQVSVTTKVYLILQLRANIKRYITHN